MTVTLRAIFVLLMLVLPSLRMATAAEAIKLFLKDGTYQLVKTYQVRGDRVRYYSVERSAWEEIPKSLVDFEATRRAQQQEKSSKAKQAEEARELDQQRFERTADAGYEVAPGIHLPPEEGVFAFDGLRLIRMVQSSAEIVTDKKRAALVLALPAPVLKSRSLVVLPGVKAAVRISVPQPTFYLQFADASGTKLELIPLRSGKGARVVEKIERAVIGKPSEVRSVLPAERAEIAPGLFKIKPSQPLAPGEYALGELLVVQQGKASQEKLNLELWDFGIEGPPNVAR